MQCPHCDGPILLDHSTTHRKAELGCGTLILIAIIVAMFSNSSDDTEREIRNLKVELNPTLQTMRRDLKDIETEIEGVRSDVEVQLQPELKRIGERLQALEQRIPLQAEAERN